MWVSWLHEVVLLSHFTDEKTGALRGAVTHSESRAGKWRCWNLNPVTCLLSPPSEPPHNWLKIQMPRKALGWEPEVPGPLLVPSRAGNRSLCLFGRKWRGWTRSPRTPLLYSSYWTTLILIHTGVTHILALMASFLNMNKYLLWFDLGSEIRWSCPGLSHSSCVPSFMLGSVRDPTTSACSLDITDSLIQLSHWQKSVPEEFLSLVSWGFTGLGLNSASALYVICVFGQVTWPLSASTLIL